MDTTIRRAEDAAGAPLPRLVDRALDEARLADDLIGSLLPLLAKRYQAEDAILWLFDPPATRPRCVGRLNGDCSRDEDTLAVRSAAERATTWVEDAETRSLAIPATHGDLVSGVVELRGPALRRPDPLDFEDLATIGRETGRFLRLVRAEEEAMIARATFRLPEEGLPLVAYIDALDGVSRTLYISPQTKDLLGYSAQEWMENHDLWEEILHPEDRDRVLAENEAATAEGRRFCAEYRVITKAGAVRWILDEAVFVHEDDRPMFWRGYMIDVTDRKDAEATRSAAEARYRALVENIPALAYIEDLEGGGILYISPQVEAMTGYTPEERISNPELTLQMVHPDDRQRFVEADRKATGTGEPFRLEYRIVAKDGRVAWLHDEAVLVRDDEDHPMFWQGVAFDVTERMEAQHERQRLLASLVSAQEEERTRIAFDVHDDPIQKLTVADLRLQTLHRKLNPDAAAELEGVQASVRDAIASMRELLVALRPPALDEGLAAALRDYVASRRQDDGAVVEVHETELVDEPSPAVRTVAYRIAQESLTNIRKHAHAGHVQIDLSTKKRGLQVSISDDGVGFSPDDADVVAGHIGLQAMRERAETAGGWFTVHSSPGEGTTVEFWLPDAAR